MYINEKDSLQQSKSKSVADTAASSRTSGSVLQKAQLFERNNSSDDSYSVPAIQRVKSTQSSTSSPNTANNNHNNNNNQVTKYRKQGDDRNSAAPTEETTRVNENGSHSHPHPRHQAEEEPVYEPPPQEAVVTPELLVDALSGHEDGLLAIAERLMDHYEGGYDVMGEAIIDAFADVQKLFQHVVEAAHMEGAAFESSRREAEATTNKANDYGYTPGDAPVPVSPNGSGPTRHDEFIDQDVRDVLIEAIQKGQGKKEAGYHMECYEIYEEACNSASALLPVDSDHRGRLQLSIARAESMNPERACAILRYAMDDVLRSGQNFRSSQNPDPSKRGDCVLKLPPGDSSVNGTMPLGVATQSSEEALASIVQEMKEVLSAPVYENSPVQDVARRFWNVLGEAQRASSKNEERLEQSLGKLKGDFLLARAEWEEKINEAQRTTEIYKKKYQNLKDQMQQKQYLETARNRLNNSDNSDSTNDATLRKNVESSMPKIGSNPSVASFGSGIAQQAKSLVGSFTCYGMGAADRVSTPQSERNNTRSFFDDGRSGVSQASRNLHSARLKASFNRMNENHMHGLEPSKV